MDPAAHKSGSTSPWLLAAFPAVKFFLHAATYRGYGFFRDEFYYIACSKRLAAGYVDHPPLSVVLLRLVRELLGDSIWALRLLPSLAGAATVLLVGLMTREMGGGRFAQALAMTAALVAPVYLGLNHFYSMNAFDLLFWAMAAYLLVRLFQGGRPWLWPVLGVVLGLGLQNKISVLWLGFGLFAGFVCTPRRRDLLTPWPWVAALIALFVFLPHVLWQVAHGWPTLEFIRNATQQKMAAVAAPAFLRSQVWMMNPVNAPVWVAGLLWLFGSASGKRFRLLGWTYLAVLALLASSGSSRAGYMAPAYTWLLASGGVALASAIERRPSWLKALTLVVVVLGGAVRAPFSLPLLPVERFIAYAETLGVAPSTAERKQLGRLPQFYADMHGWESIVSTVAEVHRRLPPEDRARSIVFAYNYGVAGAVEFLGRDRGLPRVFSGHNNYWVWGPPADSHPVAIIVGGDADDHRQVFGEVAQAGETDCDYCMPYENQNPVFVCRGLKVPLRELWPRLKHFD